MSHPTNVFLVATQIKTYVSLKLDYNWKKKREEEIGKNKGEEKEKKMKPKIKRV